MSSTLKRTWKHLATELDSNSPIEKKIELFDAFVWGSQLHVADLVINGGRNHEDTENVKPIPHSGFAALFILLSYFEMIARYQEPDARNKTSREAFTDGVLSVFPEVKQWPYAKAHAFLDRMYHGVRCGLYHMARTRVRIGIWASGEAVEFFEDNQILMIDPHKLALEMKEHFKRYIARLMDPAETELRRAFETRFDREEEAER